MGRHGRGRNFRGNPGNHVCLLASSEDFGSDRERNRRAETPDHRDGFEDTENQKNGGQFSDAGGSCHDAEGTWNRHCRNGDGGLFKTGRSSYALSVYADSENKKYADPRKRYRPGQCRSAGGPAALRCEEGRYQTGICGSRSGLITSEPFSGRKNRDGEGHPACAEESIQGALVYRDIVCALPCGAA